MNILLTAATPHEIQPVADVLAAQDFRMGSHTVKIHISGVGSLAAAYSLTREIHRHRPAFIIQAGIAGSFRESLPAPEVVVVQKETLADLGALSGEGFSDVFDLSLASPSGFPFRDKWLVNPALENTPACFGLKRVTGITINEISTLPERIELIRQKYAADLESMEGAALHYVALMEGLPFLQIRAISNFVGERNRKHWKMQEAIQALGRELEGIITQIE